MRKLIILTVLLLCLAVVTTMLGLAVTEQEGQGQARKGARKAARQGQLAEPANTGQDPGEARKPNLPEAKIAGEVASVRVSPEDGTADWPALAVTADGAVWVAYVEWNGKDADRVVVRRRAPGADPAAGWGAPIVLEDGNWDHYSPAIVALNRLRERRDGFLVGAKRRRL